MEGRLLLANVVQAHPIGDVRASGASAQSDAAMLNGTVFYSRNDGVHGRELWKSDGTNAGTLMVKDIITGPANAVAGLFRVCDSEVFFEVKAASDQHSELWKTDGTTAGTVRVRSFADYGTMEMVEVVASGNTDRD